MPPPPANRMERPQVLSPEISEMVGHRYGHLLHQARTGDANGPLGLDELRQVVQIQVVGAEIGIAIKSDDCVEKLGRKGQGSRICMDWEHLLIKPCCLDVTP